MPEFREDLVQLLFEYRSAPASWLFQSFNFLGDMEGYILVVALVYVAWDKKLAFRLALVAVSAMVLNHLLKTGLANPCPFVEAGTWAEKWAVSTDKATFLVSEYSTPSGHAMVGSAFYTYLAASLRRRWVWAAATLSIFLIGLARPYIGVHYLEDVLLGWAIGIPIAALAIRYGENFGHVWKAWSASRKMSLVALGCTILWIGTYLAYSETSHGPPLALLSYLGLSTGLLLAYPIEATTVRFDPRSSRAPIRIVRWGIAVGLVLGTLVLLDVLFAMMSRDDSILGHLLRYLRYVAAAAVGFLGAPKLFLRFGLAEAMPRAAEDLIHEGFR